MRFLHRSVTTLVLTGFLMSALSAIAGSDQSPTPEKFLGFRVGEDKKLARWEKIVEYMRVIANSSDRVRLRELCKTTNNCALLFLKFACAERLMCSNNLRRERDAGTISAEAEVLGLVERRVVHYHRVAQRSLEHLTPASALQAPRPHRSLLLRRAF